MKIREKVVKNVCCILVVTFAILAVICLIGPLYQQTTGA